MQALVDDDDQLLDRPLDCPEYALLYAPDTVAFLVSFIQRSSMSDKVSPMQAFFDDLFIVFLIVLNMSFFMNR